MQLTINGKPTTVDGPPDMLLFWDLGAPVVYTGATSGRWPPFGPASTV